jgi:hypothetical protein
LNADFFLKILGLAPFAALAGKIQASQVEERTVDLAEFHIAGFQYHDGMKRHVSASLNVGAQLLLARESGNRYDDKAISLRLPNGAMIGYVPRELNTIPTALLDQNVRLQAFITALTPEAQTWERVRVVLRQVG